VAPAQFEAVFDAYLHDDTVRGFIAEKNPAALQAMAARLDEAIRRGFWTPLRNSAWGLLDQLRRRGDDAAA
jgi:cobaltochelatase CobN